MHFFVRLTHGIFYGLPSIILSLEHLDKVVLFCFNSSALKGVLTLSNAAWISDFVILWVIIVKAYYLKPGS